MEFWYSEWSYNTMLSDRSVHTHIRMNSDTDDTKPGCCGHLMISIGFQRGSQDAPLQAPCYAMYCVGCTRYVDYGPIMGKMHSIACGLVNSPSGLVPSAYCKVTLPNWRNAMSSAQYDIVVTVQYSWRINVQPCVFWWVHRVCIHDDVSLSHWVWNHVKVVACYTLMLLKVPFKSRMLDKYTWRRIQADISTFMFTYTGRWPLPTMSNEDACVYVLIRLAANTAAYKNLGDPHE